MNSLSKPKGVVIALDLGGTWIKSAVQKTEGSLSKAPLKTSRWPNPLHTCQSEEEFANILSTYCLELAEHQKILSVVAATAGEVDVRGEKYLIAGKHLGVMRGNRWRILLEEKLECSVELINDAEAFLLGYASLEKLSTDKNVGALVVGTGLGFTMTRLGRWWKPARGLLHFGSLLTPEGSYDTWSSAVQKASLADGKLDQFLSDSRFSEARESYFKGLARIIASSAIALRLDEIILGGGVVDAAQSSKVDLTTCLEPEVKNLLGEIFPIPRIIVSKEGNAAMLRGGLALALANVETEAVKFVGGFQSLATERRSLVFENPDSLTSDQIARSLAEAEHASSTAFLQDFPPLGTAGDWMAESLSRGGRVIYIGAGTSGRVGALDAVEMPCTYGVAEDRFIPIIAGGISDAALTIEKNSEEDISSVPDLLLLQLRPEDIVIGISASGTAYFVRSAMAYGKSCGCRTILIHESDIERKDFFDLSLKMKSGIELVSGSTRMKAGTATKKILNILSTTAMIRLGKVKGGYMIDFDCSNQKLRKRAENILMSIRNIPLEKAVKILTEKSYQLRKALESTI